MPQSGVKIRIARKAHKCAWCSNQISAKEYYKTYTRFGINTTTMIVRLHSECFDYLVIEVKSRGRRSVEWVSDSGEFKFSND